MINDIIEKIETNGSSHQTNGKPQALDSTGRAPTLSTFKLETLNFELSNHTRNGKIARLPHEIREGVNRSLRHGTPYSTIIANLAEKGYPGISISSVSSWKHGGYVDWLQQQQQIEARFDRHQALERCTRAARFQGPQQNAIALAAEHLVMIMLQFDPNRALDILYRKPQLFPSFVAAVASLARSSAHLAKALQTLQGQETTVRKDLALEGAASFPANLDRESVNPSDLDSVHVPPTNSDLFGPIRTNSAQK